MRQESSMQKSVVASVLGVSKMVCVVRMECNITTTGEAAVNQFHPTQNANRSCAAPLQRRHRYQPCHHSAIGYQNPCHREAILQTECRSTTGMYNVYLINRLIHITKEFKVI